MVPRVRTLRLPACTTFHTPGPLSRETLRSLVGFAARTRAREAGLRQCAAYLRSWSFRLAK